MPVCFYSLSLFTISLFFYFTILWQTALNWPSISGENNKWVRQIKAIYLSHGGRWTNSKFNRKSVEIKAVIFLKTALCQLVAYNYETNFICLYEFYCDLFNEARGSITWYFIFCRCLIRCGYKKQRGGTVLPMQRELRKML